MLRGVPWWCRVLKIWHCHCSGLGHCRDVGLITGQGIFACCGHAPPPKKKEKEQFLRVIQCPLNLIIKYWGSMGVTRSQFWWEEWYVPKRMGDVVEDHLCRLSIITFLPLVYFLQGPTSH